MTGRRVALAALVTMGAQAANAQEPSCAPIAAATGRENLGPCVNTALDEAIPQVSPDGRTLYFTRRHAPENAGGKDDPDDVWISRRTEGGAWGPARNPGPPLNTAAPGWVLAVSADGATVLVANEVDSTGRARRGVSLARRTGEGWSPPEPVRVRDFSTRSDWGHVHLSADGGAMLLSLVREDTRGGHDLYVSVREGDGWAAPQSLGPALNTAGDEITPFLAADGVTLYFSSDGRGGMGGQDVFVARRLDERWSAWSDPVNLGAPVNTPGDDAGYVLPASGEWAYFQSSTGSMGGSDLYRVRLPEAAKPLPTVLLHGEVRAADGTPVAATVRYGAVQGPGEAGEARTDSAGRFGAALRGGAVWCVAARAARGSATESVDLRGVAAYEERALTLRLDSAAACDLRLEPVSFDVDRADIREDDRSRLDTLAAVLSRLPGAVAELAGHTDATGAAAYNRGLAGRRAAAVADYLASRGVARERLVLVAFGEARPRATNHTGAGRALNRRVEVRLRQL